MIRKMTTALVACGLALTLATPASATIAWDESVSGDFSNNGLASSVVTFGYGENEIKGTTGKGSGSTVDEDFFTFTIPAAAHLTSIILKGETLEQGAKEFFAIEGGSSITVPPSLADLSVLGWIHLIPADIGDDVLPAMGSQPTNATGFVPPLAGGTYTVWVRDSSAGASTYDLIFNVPEPGSLVLTLSGLAALGLVRRRA